MSVLILYDKTWNAHLVESDTDGLDQLYFGRCPAHKVSSPQVFRNFEEGVCSVWRGVASVVMVPDHNVLATDGDLPLAEGSPKKQLAALKHNAQRSSVACVPGGEEHHGIVRAVDPEQDFSLPGIAVVCEDLHTYSALANLASDTSTSEMEHLLVTQTIWMKKALNPSVRYEAPPRAGTSVKTVALRLIGQIGAAGVTISVIVDPAVRALSMEGSLSRCNIAMEADARSTLVAVAQTTINYVRGRSMALLGDSWERAEACWRTLLFNAKARSGAEVVVDVEDREPQLTGGTSSEIDVAVNGRMPEPAAASAARSRPTTSHGVHESRPKRACTHRRTASRKDPAWPQRNRRRVGACQSHPRLPGSALSSEGLGLTFDPHDDHAP